MTIRTNSRAARRLNQLYKRQGLVERTRRCADVVIALVFLLILAPLFLFVAVAIKLEDTGPVFVRRTCFGRRGHFEKFSFRTTIYDPENLTAMWVQRLTSVGEFLQVTRIDSLPQIVNVLRGELSFIDPAADLPSFLEE